MRLLKPKNIISLGITISSIIFACYLSYAAGFNAAASTIQEKNIGEAHLQLGQYFQNHAKDDPLASALKIGLAIGRGPSPLSCLAGWEFFVSINRSDISQELLEDSFNCKLSGPHKEEFERLKSMHSK